jgi:hypothetical protein
MNNPTPQSAPGGDPTIHQQIELLHRLVESELSPATRDLYRQLVDLRLDRSGEQFDQLAAAVGRHFPGLQAVIALVWDHVLSVPSSDLEHCCEIKL